MIIDLSQYNKYQIECIYDLMTTLLISHADHEIKIEFLINIIKDSPYSCYKVLKFKRSDLEDKFVLILLNSILNDHDVFNKYRTDIKCFSNIKYIDLKFIFERLSEKDFKKYVKWFFRKCKKTEFNQLANSDFGDIKNEIILSYISLNLLSI